MHKEFDYKNGEDYVCALCGEKKHTSGPRPDELCDGCWELSTRIRNQPVLAKRVLQNIEGARSFSFKAGDAKVGGVEQTAGETLHVLTYELGKVIEYYHKAKRYGATAYYSEKNQQKEVSDLISMTRYYCEQRGWDYDALTRLGELAYLERQVDLQKYGLKSVATEESL